MRSDTGADPLVGRDELETDVYHMEARVRVWRTQLARIQRASARLHVRPPLGLPRLTGSGVRPPLLVITLAGREPSSRHYTVRA